MANSTIFTNVPPTPVSISPVRADRQPDGTIVNQNHFGANSLFHLDRTEGPDATYDDIIGKLGATVIRYPGGGVTEQLFDIKNPTATTTDKLLWGTKPVEGLLPIDQFFSLCASKNLSATLVIPMTTLTLNGVRDSDLDYTLAELKVYIKDVLSGKYGTVKIEAFELGNEYWGDNVFPDRATAADDYGRAAAAAAIVIQQAINEHKAAIGAGPGYDEPDILVQSGWPWGLEIPTGKGGAIADQEGAKIMNHFTGAAYNAIDGVVTHPYTPLPYESVEYFSNPNEWSMSRLKKWQDFKPSLTFDGTEWNARAAETPETGLRQVGMLAKMFHELVAAGMDSLYVWPAQQTNRNALSGAEGTNNGELFVGGKGYALLSDAVLGMTPVMLDSGNRNLDVLGFEKAGDQMVLYAVSRTDSPMMAELNLGNLAPGYHHLWGKKVGVGTGADVADRFATPFVEAYNADELGGSATDHILNFFMSPYQVMRLTLTMAPHGVTITADDTTAANERLLGSAYNDAITGYAGDDQLEGGAGNDTLSGGLGDDTLIGGSGHDLLNGGAGIDTALFAIAGDVRVALLDTAGQNTGHGIDRLLGIENVSSASGHDILNGNTAANQLSGGAGNDTLNGGLGNDALIGGSGADRLIGGAGRDKMWAGTGNGIDTFVFSQPSETAVGAARDLIYNYQSGSDLIDLGLMDANTSLAGNQAFAFKGSTASAFSVWHSPSGNNIIIRGDVDGNAVADFEIALMAVSTITANDFVL